MCVLIFVVHPSDVSPFVAQEGVKYAIHISLHRIYYVKQESPRQENPLKKWCPADVGTLRIYTIVAVV